MFQFTHQSLRQLPTRHEIILWEYLRARKMVGLKFRRQHPMGPFIVDFICLSKKIIIELDGPIHDNRLNYDHNRDQWLRSQGFEIIRIKNEEVENDKIIQTLMKLREYLLNEWVLKISKKTPHLS